MKTQTIVLILLFGSFRAGLAESNIITSAYAEGLATFANGGLYGYVDTDGAVVISNRYYVAKPFSEGLAAVKTRSTLWGYINKSGELVIPARFDVATPFTNGVAIVGIASRWNRIASKLWDEPTSTTYWRIDHNGSILGAHIPQKQTGPTSR